MNNSSLDKDDFRLKWVQMIRSIVCHLADILPGSLIFITSIYWSKDLEITNKIPLHGKSLHFVEKMAQNCISIKVTKFNYILSWEDHSTHQIAMVSARYWFLLVANLPKIDHLHQWRTTKTVLINYFVPMLFRAYVSSIHRDNTR